MKLSHALKIVGLIITGLTVIFMLFTGVGDVFNAGWAGSLIVILIVLSLAWLSWKRPLLGGIIIALLSVVLAMYFFIILDDIQQASLPLLLISVPLGIGGLILIEADWLTKKPKQ